MTKHKIKLADNSEGILIKDNNQAIFNSKDYKFIFKKTTGFFARWGETTKDDGKLELGLPEIADIEISTACKQGCAFCYKSNTTKGENMSLDTFKTIFSKLPPTIGQIAFGITDIDANPDMWDIFDHSRANGVIPNVTINGSNMTPVLYDRLVNTMGAVAVSVYDKDTSYGAIKELTDRGMKQVNIHKMICLENFEETKQVLNDYLTDPRLTKLNAIVLLSLKPKGRAENRFHKLPQDKFNELVHFALNNNIPLGFDSCGCHKFLKSIEGIEEYKKMESFAEPCESTIYSSYINVDGYFFPCSFAENGNENGLSVVECNDFLDDIWYNEKTNEFRKKAIECRNCKVSCSLFEI